MERRAFSPKPMWKKSKKRVRQLWPLHLFLRLNLTHSQISLTVEFQDYNSQPPAAPLNTFGTSNPVDDWNRLTWNCVFVVAPFKPAQGWIKSCLLVGFPMGKNLKFQPHVDKNSELIWLYIHPWTFFQKPFFVTVTKSVQNNHPWIPAAILGPEWQEEWLLNNKPMTGVLVLM